MVAATGRTGVPALFGIEERDGDDFFITQVYAWNGRIFGVQRKRHLGEGEQAHSVGEESTLFELGSLRFGVVICAESGVDFTWDASANAGADIVFFPSAPGLYGRRTDEASWQTGFDWWDSRGLGDARAQAARCGLWVAMSTQAGSASDEDFPGIAAVVSPDGVVVDRLPDWRPGLLITDIPLSIDIEPVRWAVRIVVINGDGRTLLAQFVDDDTGRAWWVPPGGGIEPGEDDLAAARRELFEELGRDDLVIGEPIGHRGGPFFVRRRWFSQHERWYVCRCDAFEVGPEVMAATYNEGILAMRWWSADEIRHSAIDTGPRDLADLLDAINAGAVLAPDADLGR
jgi:predicted amidohydrolase